MTTLPPTLTANPASLSGPAAPPVRPGARPLRGRVIRGSAWMLGAFGVSQALRLAGNVQLAEWLSSTAFGLMGVVNLVLQGLQMFSDVGIGPSIVRSPRGEEPGFLRTAWTVQIVRGFVLWGVGAAAAWPVAVALEQPALAVLIPVASAVAAIAGFNSTALFTANRHLLMGRLAALELMSQIVSLAVVIVWVYFTRSVWGLVGGSIAGAAIRLAATHALDPERNDRLGWDRAAARELFVFGRWIVISTAITFLADHAYRFVAAEHLTIGMFGVFSIALMFPLAVQQGVSKLTQSVIFPAYAQMARDPGRDMRPQLAKVQAAVLALGLPVLCGLVVFGPFLIRVLYREEYWDAGWMLQVLAAGQIVLVVTAGTVPVLLARGDSLRHMLVLASRFVLLLAGMGIGLAYAGTPGLIAGIAAANLANYPVVVWAVRRYNAWVPWLDAAALSGSAVVIAAGLWATGQIG